MVEEHVYRLQCPPGVLSSVGFLRKPDMRNARTNEYEISRMEFFNGIAYNPLSGTFSDKAEFKFLVIMPGTLIDMILEDPNVEGFIRIQFYLLQQLLHTNLILHKNNK